MNDPGVGFVLAPHANADEDVDDANEAAAQVQCHQSKHEFLQVELNDVAVSGFEGQNGRVQNGFQGGNAVRRR